MDSKTVNVLKRAAMKALGKRAVQEELYEIVNKKFLQKKAELINDFKSHAVSREISAGESASNSSGTLTSGNLFSFIGFLQGENPVDKVASYIETHTRLIKKPVVYEAGNSTYLQFEVRFPGKEDLKDISGMPWETGRSWLFAIEEGISGLSYYLYGRSFPMSRSSTAIQTGNQIRKGAAYKKTPYISLMLSKFENGWGRL